MPIPIKRRTSDFKNTESLYVPGQDDEPQEDNGSFLSRTVGNIPGSAMNLIGGLGDAVMNPKRTIEAIGGIAGGAVDKLLPGEQGGEENFDALVNFYKERYGSIDKLLQTIEKDPVGFATDASVVLGGAGGVLSAAGKVSKVSALSKAGSVVSKAGQVTNPLSAVSGVASLGAKTFPWIARTLEKANLRLTPVQKANMGTKLNELADYSAKRGIIGSPMGRFDKVVALIEKTEDTLQNFFSHMSKGSVIDKQSIIRSLQSLKGAYKNNRDSIVINKQIDGAIRQIQKMGSVDDITYAALNEFKRTTYRNAYNKAGNKVLDDVEHAIGDIARKSIEQGLEGLKIQGLPIKQFNADYGKLLQLKKLLKIASGRPQISGIAERLLGSALGFGVAGPGGSLLGAAVGHQLIGNLPITLMRSATATGLSKLGDMRLSPLMRKLIEAGKTGALGVERVNEITE